jgi:uncharacterized SAM-binding protein YcdF (DUF218 family)
VLFWLKKIVSFPAQPLPAALLLMLAGAILLRTKRRRLGRVLFIAGLVVIVAITNTGVAHLLTDPLEHRYAAIPELHDELPADLADAQAVVVLGSGHLDDPRLSAVNQLFPSGLSRLMEGLRLLHHLPQAQLIVSGAPGLSRLAYAQVAETAARSLGVEPSRIARMDDPRDTHDEVTELTRRLGDKPFVLVTSAAHMPRAMAMCQKVGLHAHPAPADYRLDQWSWSDLLSWNAGALDASTRSLHEWVGRIWAWLRGQV